MLETFVKIYRLCRRRTAEGPEDREGSCEIPD